MIIKSSPWKEAHLFIDHPEYSAIFALLEKHRGKIRFILVGSSSHPSEISLIGDGIIAVDVQRNSTVGQVKYNLELIRLHLRFRPNLTIVLGLIQLPPAIYSFFSRKFKYVPVLLGEFGYYGRSILGKTFNNILLSVNSFFLHLSCRSILRLFALSNYVRDGIVKSVPVLCEKTELVSYPLSPLFSLRSERSTKTPEGSGTPIVLTNAAIEPRKGLDVLIKAVSLVGSTKLLIKGPIRDPVYANSLRKLVKRLKVEDNVAFVTETIPYAELFEYYESATLFVFPTREDSLGVVVLEALQCNLPVIATNVGGIPDMINNGENGILVKPDDENELADAISLLLASASKRASLAKNARPVLFAKYYLPRITLGEALDRSVRSLY